MDRRPTKALGLAVALIVLLVQCSGGRAIRFQVPEEEMDLHPNELSVIEPGSLAVHPDMAKIGGQATLSLNVTSAIEDGDFVAVSVESSTESVNKLGGGKRKEYVCVCLCAGLRLGLW